MAFPYYQPNYQPYYPQQQQQQTSGILWVSSELEAQSFPVAPNNAVALWDSTKPAVYLKQADASGRPTLKAYTLTELAQIKQQAQESSNTDFAKKTPLTKI